MLVEMFTQASTINFFSSLKPDKISYHIYNHVGKHTTIGKISNCLYFPQPSCALRHGYYRNPFQGCDTPLLFCNRQHGDWISCVSNVVTIPNQPCRGCLLQWLEWIYGLAATGVWSYAT